MAFDGPAYLRKYGAAAQPADLVSHACIQMRSPMTGQPLDWEFVEILGAEAA
jgi:hypothetical protein